MLRCRSPFRSPPSKTHTPDEISNTRCSPSLILDSVVVDHPCCRKPHVHWLMYYTFTIVASHWLERSSCRFQVTLLVFSQAHYSTSQVLTTFYVDFISTLYWRLASKASKLIRPLADWSTAVTSHAAFNSDARSIQISSRNIRIRR